MTAIMATTKKAAGLERFPKAHQRFIVENFWPAAYATGDLFEGTYHDGTPRRLGKHDLAARAALYERGIRWTNLMRRLAADAGQSVRRVPPIAAYHTAPQSAADLFAASGNTFARDCAKLAERDGREYRAFKAACAQATRALALEPLAA